MSQSDKQYAVVGLGRFGMSICEELSAQGAEVLAIDINEELVQKASDVATQAIVADVLTRKLSANFICRIMTWLLSLLVKK